MFTNDPTSKMEILARRRWRVRVEAIGAAIDRAGSLLQEAAGDISDAERIRRDTSLRLARAQSAGGRES